MNSETSNIEEWEKAYSSQNARHKNLYPSENVISYILGRHRNKTLKVLDIGCGYGNNLRFLLQNGFDAYGIDFSSNVIEEIKEEFGDRVSTCNAKKLTFEDDSFDLIIDRSSLQHNPKEDLSEIFKECRRVLKRGGELFSNFLTEGENGFILANTTENELLEILSKVFDQIEHETHTKYYHLSQKKLVATIVIAK